MRLIKALLASSIIAFIPAVASAHVVVKPSEVGIGAFQTFTTGVPNEKDSAVTGLRLVIPAGLKEVSANVKPGWVITQTTGTDEAVTQINWTGGQIPVGQRDDFVFSAQAPASPATLRWKAYQTYADGTVVSWDQQPNGKDDEESTPYSITAVVDDLKKPALSVDGKANIALGLAGAALILALGVGITRRSR